MKFKAWVALLALTLVSPLILIAENAKGNLGGTKQLAAVRSYAKLPLSFEPAATTGRYVAHNGAYTVSIGGAESFVSARDAKGSTRTLRFGFLNSSKSASAEGFEPLPGVINYYQGKDAKDWRLGVQTFAKVRAQKVYPGVDVVYYGDNRQLEFDFVVAPKADPGAIALSFAGEDKLSVSAEGDLVATLGQREVRFTKPVAYQRINGQQTPVKVEYALNQQGETRLLLGDYDTSQELIIDPVLSYSTFLGGGQADTGNGLDVDTAGNIYVTGQTCSSDFSAPSPNPSNTIFKASLGGCDAYVTKIDPASGTLVYTTFIAGQTPDPPNATASGNAIAIDAGGRAYVVGTTNFWDLPLTSPNPVGRTSAYNGGDSDVFIAILNPDGTLLRATYLGGSSVDQGYSITVDRQQNVAAVGQTCSSDFPAYNSIQAKTEACVAFITKLDFGLHIAPPIRTGASPVSPRPASLADACGAGSACPSSPNAANTYYFFSTLFGGQLLPPEPSWPGGLNGVHYTPGVLVPFGAITIATPVCGTGSGEKPQVLMSEGSGITGGIDNNWPCGSIQPKAGIPDDGGFVWFDLGDAPEFIPYATTEAYGVALDPVGDVFAVGGTNTADLTPYLNYAGYSGINYGKTGAWILKLNGLSGDYIYATALGTAKTEDPGQSVNAAKAVAVDASARAYVVGTATGGISTTTGTYSPGAKGKQDVFVIRLNTAASAFDYGTYFGGSGDDQGLAITLDAGGAAYITGSTTSTDLPIVNPLVDASGNNAETAILGPQDAFVAKLSPTGAALIMSAYMGGVVAEQGNGIVLDKNGLGNIYVAGTTASVDFPLTAGAVKNVYGGGTSDAFVVMINGASFPKVSLSPASINFGLQNVGGSAQKQTVTLQNTGNGMLSITSIQIAVGTDFSQTNDCGNQLTPAGGAKDKCTITVTFTPSQAGMRTDQLKFVDNSADTPQVVGLSGNGVVAQGLIQLSPGALTFGSQQVGTTSAVQTVTLTNTSSVYALTISSITVGGDFKQTNNCPASLAATANCAISITFAPTTAGSQGVSLTVTGAAVNSPQTVALTGTGTTAAPSGSPDFTLTSSSQSVTISASGGTGTFNVFATPLNGFKQTLNFTCSLPGGAVCSVAPTSLVMDGTSIPSVGVTVTIPGAGGGITRGDNRKGARPIYASILPFCLIGAMFAGKKRHWMYALLIVLVCVTLASFGCGGGGGSDPSSNANKMTPGTYQVSIAATTTGTTPMSHTMTVTLQVN